MSAAVDVDVLVVGGGHAGLAFARLLAVLGGGRRPGLSIAVLDAGDAPATAPDAEVGLRVVALSPGSRTILERCAAWPLLPAQRVGPYRRMVVWHPAGAPDGAASIHFDAAGQGVAELGYIVENELLRAALWHAPGGGLQLLPATKPAALAIDADAASVSLAGGGLLRARLVVGADGHASWLRQALGVGAQHRAYGQHAVVAHLASERPHDDTAWQCFLPDGPVALLPLADGRVSLVWSCASARAAGLLALAGPEFEREVTAAAGGVLGGLRLTTQRAAFELAAANAAQYSGLRYALIGDAAHRVHPLAGQGVNLAFRDAVVLAQVLADHLALPHADPGDPLALRRFERARRGENAATIGAMSLINAAFSSSVPGLSRMAGHGLVLVDRLGPVKALLADMAMGRTGEVPAWVRRGSAS